MKEMISWIKNKNKIQQEREQEDKQYNDVLTENSKLKKKIESLDKELIRQINLKETYLKNCKRLKRKLKEVSK
ncbi:MAG: hypothetical protein V8Q71_00050 [Bacilli bacterium]